MAEKNEIVKAMLDVEMYPSFPKQELATKTKVQVPLAELAMGCASFAAATDAFRTVTQTFDIPTEGLYRFTSRGYGGGPTALHDGSGYLSTITREGEGIVGQGAYVPVDSVQMTSTTTVPFDPMTLAIAIALTQVNQKLDSIQATQEEMLEFLKEDKRAEIRGDMKTLAETLNGYKFNSDNENWHNTRHQGILDIKRRAEQHIEFYRAQIAKKAAEGGFIHGDMDVAKKSSELIDYLGQYQAALYLLGFSTFLDVAFAGSFDFNYLKNIEAKLNEYGVEYRQLYTDVYNQLEAASSSSIEGMLIGGVAGASSFLGKALSKVPVLEKGPVDEVLQGVGSSLDDLNKTRLSKALEQLSSRKDANIHPFVENISLINNLCNGETTYYLDGDTLYFDSHEAPTEEDE